MERTRRGGRPRGVRWTAWGILALAVAGAWSPVAAQEEGAFSLVYLVRHAERDTDHPSDPGLTAAGNVRAEELARLLADAPLDRVLSTDFRRTRLTAAPVAEAHGLTVELYDPRGEGLSELAEHLRTVPGRYLVVGHSNTTPALATALGGDPVSPIGELEYDRLYLVVVGPGGAVTSTLLRFGAPFADGGDGGGEGSPERGGEGA